MSAFETMNGLVNAALNRPTISVLASDPSSQFSAQDCLERDCWSPLKLMPIEQASHARITDAVQAAQDTFRNGEWANRSKFERRRVLLIWAELIERHAHALAYLNCLETGRSLTSLVRDSLPKAIQALRWFAELVDKLDDRSVHTGGFGGDIAIIRREPLGVVAVILPWNDPLVTLVWKCAPALAMGNSVIVKPSEYATLVLIEAILLAHQAGIPVGALQVVTGNGEVGRMLVKQPVVEKIAFTGSSRTAAAIGADAHATGLKRLSFECGGKGAFILCPSGRAVKEFSQVVARNMFYNQGQVCSAPSIVHAHETQIDELIAHISDAASGFLPGNPIDESSVVGLMVSRTAVARVRYSLQSLDSRYFAGAVGEHALQPAVREWSITPTVLTGLPDDHSFWDTELFAPVLLVRPYHDVMQAVEHASASKYGLSAGVWSQDIDEAMAIASQLCAGNVHINSWGDDPNQVPFGGVKQSGHGREKSIDAMDSYSQLKSIFYRPHTR